MNLQRNCFVELNVNAGEGHCWLRWIRWIRQLLLKLLEIV